MCFHLLLTDYENKIWNIHCLLPFLCTAIDLLTSCSSVLPAISSYCSLLYIQNKLYLTTIQLIWQPDHDMPNFVHFPEASWNAIRQSWQFTIPISQDFCAFRCLLCLVLIFYVYISWLYRLSFHNKIWIIIIIYRQKNSQM